MNTVLLFPGQGSQHAGMLHELPNHPAVRDVFGEVSEVLGYDVRNLDSEEALRSTVSVQLALLAAAAATARILLAAGLEFTAVAGLSIGAFGAAVAAESIALSDAVRLVRSRAQQMEALYPVGYGLAAIVGLDEKQVTQLVGSVFTAEEPVYVANINAPRQIVIAGAIGAMKKVLSLATAKGAQKTEVLPVATPSHCPLLESVAHSLSEQMKTIRVNNPKVVYISDVNARAVRSGSGVAADLADNIGHSVRWHDATSLAQELGCELFLQAPPGHVLSDLIRENLPGSETCVVSPATLDRCLRLARG